MLFSSYTRRQPPDLSVPAMSFSHLATKLWMLCKLAKSNLREKHMSQIGFISPRVGTNQKNGQKTPLNRKNNWKDSPNKKRNAKIVLTWAKASSLVLSTFWVKKTLGIQLQTSQLHPRLYCRQGEEPKPAPSVSPSSGKKNLFQSFAFGMAVPK